MSASRLARRRVHSRHVCPSCSRPFVYPDVGVPCGRRWRVLLRCLSCEWSGESVFDDATLEEFERELDEERARIELDLERLTQHNMRDYRDRFVAALAADAILPEDF